MIRIISVGALSFGLLLLAPVWLSAEERRPFSVSALDQSDLRGPYYDQLPAGLRGVSGASPGARVTIYGESLDLPRLGGTAYAESLKRQLREKDRDRPIGVAAAIGAGAFDGEGTFYPPSAALGMIAESANRAIVGAEPPLPAGESSLPEDSQIRLYEPTLFERYRWQSVAILAALFLQAGLITFLLHERRLRRHAETQSRNRMSELAHVNRQATAGELSSSIAHELNQPLGSILANAEAAELILKSPDPDLEEVREILADIKRDDQRAGEVIRRQRAYLTRTPFETKDIDLNQIMDEAFKFLSVQATSRNIALYLQHAPQDVRIKGDPVQLQQVILNLVVNSMDAMSTIPYGRTVIGRIELNGGATAEISISDSGPGIPPDKLAQVFDPFFTTKDKGMGIGLSIARTIILAHKGSIWAENQTGGGAAFRFVLPLAA